MIVSPHLPAILGGLKLFPDGPPGWPRPDADVRDVLRQLADDLAWGRYRGEHVPALEAELAEAFGVASALTCASGTFALEIALKACGVTAGDEVILAGYDYDATAHVILGLGAIPVFVDVRPGTISIDPELVPGALSERTRAIIVSHLHGALSDVDWVRERAAGVPIVEDAAQAPGARDAGKAVGSRGDLGILSFGGSKLLSAGRGGAILVQNTKLGQRSKILLQRGSQQIAPLSEMQAAILRPQLRRLAADTGYRNMSSYRLRNRVGRDTFGLDSWAMLDGHDAIRAWYKVGFRVEEAKFGVSRDRLVEALQAEGIAVDAGFRPGHIGRAKSRYRAGSALEHAEAAGRETLILHHPVLSGSEEDVRKVAEGFERAYQYRNRLRG